MLINKHKLNPIVLKEEKVTLEYGEQISSNLEDYIDVEKSKRDFVVKAQLDFSEISMKENKDYSKLGKYKLYINCDEEKYEVEINVQDAVAPEIKELKSPLIYKRC